MDKQTIKRNTGTEMRADGIYRDGVKVRGGKFSQANIDKYNAQWAPKKKAAPALEPAAAEAPEEEVADESDEETSSSKKKSGGKNKFAQAVDRAKSKIGKN
jgi:hypothetical protein